MCLPQPAGTKDEYSYATPVDSLSRPKVREAEREGGREGGREHTLCSTSTVVND